MSSGKRCLYVAPRLNFTPPTKNPIPALTITQKRRLNKAQPTSNTTATATTGAASQPIAVPTCRDIPDYDANLRALAAASTRRAVEGVPGGPANSSLLSDTSPSLGGLYTARGTPLPPHTALPQPHAHLASDSDPPTGLSSLAALDAPPDPADAYIIYQEDVLARDQRRDPPLLQYDMDEEDEAALAAVNAATVGTGGGDCGSDRVAIVWKWAVGLVQQATFLSPPHVTAPSLRPSPAGSRCGSQGGR